MESLNSMPAHSLIPDSKLAFHPDRANDVHAHPLIGLTEFGPYSRSLISSVVDPIRVAFIGPANSLHVRDALLEELESRLKPKERPEYLVDFPGFSRVFGVRAVAADDASILFPIDTESRLLSDEKPHLRLGAAVINSIKRLKNSVDFDVVLIYLPDAWKLAFECIEEGFDLHDYIKGFCAVLGMPTQIILESKALQRDCRCSVAWTLSIALYTKAGGVPWTLADQEPESAYIGVSYALRKTSEGTEFVTCCSQVFDADGAGLEFVAYEFDGVDIRGGNPYLSELQMRKLMARSLELYQRKHVGRAPKRITVHKSTPFKDREVDGCFQALSTAGELRLLQVQQDTPWRGIRMEAPSGGAGGKPVAARFPVSRGSLLPIGGDSTLLWTQGDCPSFISRGKSFYKEARGIPNPILLRRYAGAGDWIDDCRDVLGLTKMDWNNDGLYNRLPVTMSYASVLADIIKRMPRLEKKPYQFRFFM